MIIGARSRRILLYSTKLRAILIRLATILLLTACSDSSRPSLSMTLGGIVTVEPDDVPVSVKARDRLLFLAVVQHPDGVKDLSIFGSREKRCSQGIVGSLQSIGFTDSDEIEGSIPTRAVAHWSDGFAQAVCSTRRKLERWQISAFAQAEHDSGESLTTGPVTIGTGLAPFQALWVWDELWVTD